MKLTNTLRDAFVRAAMNDVPSVDYVQQMRELMLADAVKQLPAPVKALWDDPKTRDFLNLENARLPGKIGGYAFVPCARRMDYNPSASAQKKLDGLVDRYSIQREQHNKLKADIKAVAYGCSTRKQLVESLPEFAKYLPLEAAPADRTLPVVANVVTEFVKAGWPKKS